MPAVRVVTMHGHSDIPEAEGDVKLRVELEGRDVEVRVQAWWVDGRMHHAVLVNELLVGGGVRRVCHGELAKS